MDWTLFLPGLIIAWVLFFLCQKARLIPRIKLPKWRVDVKKTDEFILNLGLIGFFCMVFVGIKGFDWRIACIICGMAGVWFCYPRGEGK